MKKARDSPAAPSWVTVPLSTRADRDALDADAPGTLAEPV